MTTDIRERRFLPALVAVVVAAFLVIPMVTSAPLVRAQSQDQEDPCEGVPRSTFEDRNEADEVHRRSIDCVDFYDISSGNGQGLFLPDRLVKRDQMATFIINTLEAAGLGDRLPDGDPPDEFDDISDSVHRANINRLARIGVVRGSNGSYNPQEDVRRDQMASFLLQAKEWAYQEDYEPTNSYFRDVRPTNPHFDNVNAAYEEGLVRGTEEPDPNVPNSGAYAPGRSVRRQNMASFLSNELRQVDGAPEQFCEEPSPSPTSTASARPTSTASPRPTSTTSASPSPTATATASGGILSAAQESPTATASPSSTASPCATRDGSPSPSPSSTASPRPTSTASPTTSPTATSQPCTIPIGPLCPSPSPSSTASPTASPTASATPTSSGLAVPQPLSP